MRNAPESRIRLSLPVTLLLERRLVVRRFWSRPLWRLHGVLAGAELVHARAAGRKVRDTGDGGELWSWSGYRLTLYKDACERYWHALIGDKPRVYVVCRERSDGSTAEGDVDAGAERPDIEPQRVTLDYDDANASGETDSLVLSAPIPGDLYRHMEAFVLEHYRPRPFTKRKRRNWSPDTPPDDAGRRR